MLVPHNAPGVGPLVAATFPKNRKPVRVKKFCGPITVNSYWDGGSKDEYRLIDLETRQVYAVPTSHPYFNRKSNGERCGNIELRELPPGTALICGGYFCGKPATVRVMLRPENLAKLLPAPSADLTEQEKATLDVICGIKGGQYRRDEFRYRGLGEYSANHPAIVSLAERGFLKINKAGAVSATIDGRNAR